MSELALTPEPISNDYWDLPSVCQHDEDRANAAGIDLRQHISGADEPHDVTRTLDRLLRELRLDTSQ